LLTSLQSISEKSSKTIFYDPYNFWDKMKKKEHTATILLILLQETLIQS